MDTSDTLCSYFAAIKNHVYCVITLLRTMDIHLREISSSNLHHEFSDVTHLEVVWWRQRPQEGGQDVDGENHRQISHGLTGAQRVGVGGSN